MTLSGPFQFNDSMNLCCPKLIILHCASVMPIVVESQNNRIFNVGREFCRSFSGSWQGHQDSKLHGNRSGWVLNVTREGDSLGNLFLCSAMQNKMFFLMLTWRLLCFILRSWYILLSLGTNEKSLAPFTGVLCTFHIFFIVPDNASL